MAAGAASVTTFHAATLGRKIGVEGSETHRPSLVHAQRSYDTTSNVLLALRKSVFIGMFVFATVPTSTAS